MLAAAWRTVETMNRDDIPEAIRGEPPGWWRGDLPEPLAWGPFVVETARAQTRDVGIGLRVEHGHLVWFDFDREHVFTLTGDPLRVVDGQIRAQSVEHGQVVIRPLVAADRPLVTTDASVTEVVEAARAALGWMS